MKRPSTPRRWLLGALPVCLGAALTAVAVAGGHSAGAAATAACAAPSGPPRPVTPTTVDTIGQAYRCLLDHYFDHAALDDRALLDGGYAGLTQELGRLGLDRSGATAPALTGDRDTDWAAFAAAYSRVVNRLPAAAAARQRVAAATMNGMVASLGDNHAHWRYPVFPPDYQPGQAYGLGLATSPDLDLMIAAPAEALPPLFVTVVYGGPAAAAGLRPGDEIVAVDGSAPYVDGRPSPGVAALLQQAYPQADVVAVTVRRPSTGRTWTVSMRPGLFTPDPAATRNVTSKLLDGDVAYVKLGGFAPHAADDVLAAVDALAKGRTLRGLVLDLRGNGGGSPAEVARLTGAFAHGKVINYDCATRAAMPDHCTANHTDPTVPPLRLPLVTLTDRNCASACDAFADAVKDLRLGTLVGTRTAGVVAGPADGYQLNDNSQLVFPSAHELGANRETVNGIGVPPDWFAPVTPADLSNGRDRGVDRALALLHH
ncbi:MAG: S41 family peptidase [Mycobacteriales bacterium]